MESNFDSAIDIIITNVNRIMERQSANIKLFNILLNDRFISKNIYDFSLSKIQIIINDWSIMKGAMTRLKLTDYNRLKINKQKWII